ncbi:sodium/proline symporter [bacterium]|nr:sodium/proline symporter [bacterium]
MDVYEQLRNPIALSIFVLTLLFPVIVGFLTLHRTKNQSDFFIGGRNMNKLVVALSAVSSGRSSWLVLGVSGMAYKLGVSAIWAVTGYILAELFQFIYIGRKLRTQTESYQSITLLDYFESRFQDHHHLIRITGALIIGIFITAYVAAQLKAGADSLCTATGLPVIATLVIACLMILIYMALGGFIAVAYNDVVRAIIMLFGLVIFPAVGLIRLGGLSSLLNILRALDPSNINPLSIGFGALIGFLGIGLGSPGQPHIIVRYMAIDNADQLRKSAVIGTFWNVLMGWGAVMIGLLGRAIIPKIQNLPDQNPEMVYLVLSDRYFGPVLYGLLVGGIFAAILSTADSQLLVVASTFVRDIYEKILRRGIILSESNKLALSRWIVIGSGLIALILACLAKDIIFWLVLFAWGGLGAAFGPALILSLYWEKTTKEGIASGMIAGSLITIFWKLFLKTSTGIYELIPAFFGAFGMIIMVSCIQNKIRRDELQS